MLTTAICTNQNLSNKMSHIKFFRILRHKRVFESRPEGYKAVEHEGVGDTNCSSCIQKGPQSPGKECWNWRSVEESWPYGPQNFWNRQKYSEVSRRSEETCCHSESCERPVKSGVKISQGVKLKYHLQGHIYSQWGGDKSEIIIKYKKEETCTPMDIAILSERKTSVNDSGKINKCKNLGQKSRKYERWRLR